MAFYSRFPIGKHKDCGGRIVDKYDSGQASDQFGCTRCGKVWGVVSDLSDIQVPDYQSRRPGSSFIFELEDFSVHANAPSVLINWMFNNRLMRVLDMLDSTSNTESVGLDIGCAHGYLTQHLAMKLNGAIVGVDVCRNDLYRAKIRAHLRARFEKSSKTIEYVLCNANYLPFKKGSVNVVTCISVLEHINDLESAVKEIKATMSNKGYLIAGYPIETRLFMALLKVFLPSGLAIRDPKILGAERFESMPETHKQSFTAIRDRLQAHLSRVERQKSFFTIFPDQLSWYECVKMQKEN